MGKKVLAYKIPQVMITYPYNAFYLGILEANNINYQNILINEFLTIYYYKKCGMHRIDFNKSGKIESKRFESIEFPNTNNIIETIKKQIDCDFYAIVMLNQKYLNNENVHTESDYSHDWLIYGYDDSLQYFYCSSCIGKKGEKRIGTIKLHYLDIKESLQNVSYKYLKPSPSYFRNHFIKINFKWTENEPTKIELYHSIKNMFFPKIFIRDGYWHPSVGIYSLNKLAKKFKKMYIVKKIDKPIFLQNIRIIYEFRQNTLLCLKMIGVQPQIIEKYEFIVNDTYKTLLYSLKYNVTKNKNLLNTIYDKLKNENKLERKILKLILKTYKP